MRGNFVVYGDFGIMVFEFGWIISNQIEVVRVVIVRYIKRGGKVWIKIFFDKFVIRKLVEICMGFGKGLFEYWVVVVKFGRVMFEVGGVDEEVVKEVLRFVIYKLFIKCKIVLREEVKVGGEVNEGV